MSSVPSGATAMYRPRTSPVSAVQWFPGVDVPGVFLGRPLGYGEREEPRPAILILGDIPCMLYPGCWIVTEPSGRRFVYATEEFAHQYEPVSEAP